MLLPKNARRTQRNFTRFCFCGKMFWCGCNALNDIHRSMAKAVMLIEKLLLSFGQSIVRRCECTIKSLLFYRCGMILWRSIGRLLCWSWWIVFVWRCQRRVLMWLRVLNESEFEGEVWWRCCGDKRRIGRPGTYMAWRAMVAGIPSSSFTSQFTVPIAVAVSWLAMPLRVHWLR